LRSGPLYIAYVVPNPSFDDQRQTAAFRRIKTKLSGDVTTSGKENLVLHDGIFIFYMKITNNLGIDGVFWDGKFNGY
jgi:hypothetical protein